MPVSLHLHAQARVDPSLPEAPMPQREGLLFPDYDTVYRTHGRVPALRTWQKFQLAGREIVSPSLVIESVFDTAFDEAANVGPNYGHGFGAAAQLFGYNVANLATTSFFTDGLMPAVLHQDPRYFRKGHGTKKSRFWWAVKSSFVTYSDSGARVPNTASFLGLGMSAALANAYLPERNVSFSNTMESYLIKEAVGCGSNVVHEFGGVKGFAGHLKRRKGPSDPDR